jgi:hypothetical protein
MTSSGWGAGASRWEVAAEIAIVPAYLFTYAWDHPGSRPVIRQAPAVPDHGA